jgi:hypothetical protein
LGDVWHGVTHFAGEVGKWFHENWRIVVVVVVVIVVEVVTFGAATPAVGTLGAAILAGAAAGATAGALGAALYGGTLDEDIQAAFKGAVIGAVSAAVSGEVSEAFAVAPGETASTCSEIGSIAAHGVVGGARQAAEGGKFWQGFAAAAATETTSAFGLDTKISDLHVVRAALVGGTVAAISGGKFVNGAVFSSLQEVIAGGYSENQSPGRPLTEEEKVLYRYSFDDRGEILDDSVLESARVHEGEVPFWLGSSERAVTIGNNIYIRPGEYDPDSVDGAELLGHELTHVQQFRNGLTIIDYIWAARNGLENNKYENEAYGNEPAFGQSWVWQRGSTGRIFCGSLSCP